MNVSSGSAVFVPKASAKSTSLWQIAGGAGLFLLGILGLIAAIALDLDQIGMHSISTLPTTGGVFLMIAGFNGRNGQERIEVSSSELIIGEKPAKRFVWSDFLHCEVEDAAGGASKTLKLFDANGKTVVKISNSVERFDQLVELVRQCIRDDARASQSHSVATKRWHRKAYGFAVLGLVGCFLSAFIGYEAWWTHQATQRLANEAIVGKGVLTEKFVAPNGKTKRFRYRVAGEGATSAEHNVEVRADVFEASEPGDAIAVRYVEATPSIAELVDGEVKDRDLLNSAIGSGLLAIVAGLGSLFFLLFSVFTWHGYDIDVSDKGVQLMQYGEPAKGLPLGLSI